MKTIVGFWFVLGALSAAGEVYVAEVGKKATLDCGVMAIRSNLEWHKMNVKIISQSNTGFISRGNADISKRSKIKQDIQLDINLLEETDAGEITCTADGKDYTHRLIVVRDKQHPNSVTIALKKLKDFSSLFKFPNFLMFHSVTVLPFHHQCLTHYTSILCMTSCCQVQFSSLFVMLTASSSCTLSPSVPVSISPSANLEVGSTATLNCQAKGLDPSPTVRWKKPDKSFTTSDTVTLSPVAASDGGTWQCVVTIKDKEFEFSHSLSVRAFATTTSTTSTTPSKPQKPDNNPGTGPQPGFIMRSFLGLKLWVWIAIGVGCLVLILLIIFVIIMCRRIRRKKRKFLRIKHAQQSQRPKKYCQCHNQTAAAKPQQGRRREKPSALPLQAY
ncbi:CD4-2 molecule, tandem duplicate 1 [Leuresthes tenuis]|uniref:CD4-2 molecule, tandem duplicate 1 n=1 Tax=Leuresthes tenuis TaxID=355514 RepID=UPI003B50C600